MVRTVELHSCSTFVLAHGDNLLVGHNLDDYIPVPGLVVINKRGVAKENIGWEDLRLGWSKSRPRIRWVARYGSLTGNTFGLEFPDGGLNEAGLYAGETTLLGTVYPPAHGRPQIYHHQWVQYVLDNFATVEAVLADLPRVVIDGHCQWHFFLADARGQAAVIEFRQGEPVVYTGERLPVPVLCNTAYADELAILREREGFGGTRPVDFADDKGPERFAQAATMLQRYTAQPTRPALEFAFAILQQLVCGNNKWQTVYDVREHRLHYRTYRTGDIRSVSLAAFDLSPAAPAMMLDIHAPGSGDVSGQLQPYDATRNRRSVAEAWSGIDLGFPLNVLFKPLLVRRLSHYAHRFQVR
jgi:choloylglycine hydrolase